MIPTPLHPMPAVSGAGPSTDAPQGAIRFRDRVRERAGAQELLVLRIGDERFAVALESVDELVESPRLRHVPGAPPALLGLFTLGAALLPLYSPATVLGASPLREQVALVMRGGRSRVALAVDDADDVISVSLADVIDAPRTGHHDDVVLGVIWRDGELLTLLDARAVVASYAALSLEGR
jgi:chemotaxis signal transduction protein